MADWLNTVVVGATALASSALTALVTAKAAERQSHGQSRAELGAALASYGMAVDMLGLEIGQLPPAPTKAVRASQAAVAKLPNLDWSLGQMSRHTLGRRTTRAVEAYSAAMNRLILIAPTEVLAAAEVINGLLSRLGERDDQWQVHWSEAREKLAAASRAALDDG